MKSDLINTKSKVIHANETTLKELKLMIIQGKLHMCGYMEQVNMIQIES